MCRKRLSILLAAALLPVFGAPVAAQQTRPPTFPYLDGSEAALPGYAPLADRVADSYVMVTLLARGDGSIGKPAGPIHTGSGFVVDTLGHIVSAAHIVRGPQFDILVTLRDGSRLPARVVRVSAKQELALVRIEPPPGLKPLPFGRSAGLRIGEPALAIGSPGPRWGVASVGTVRLPRIAERLDYGDWGFANGIELAMRVEIGHSGGPVVNARGEAIGMIAGFELGEGGGKPAPKIAYAVPIDDIRAWLGR
jgi:putative serine protease PepD